MPSFQLSTVILTLGILLLFARPAHAFGAGNIGSLSSVEGINWRHGDIEDTLLTLLMSRAAGGKKFDKLNVARVYFGNFLRDYSQAIDVGTCKYVSAEAIRILIWILGFMTFGYGTKEFEITAERLGCYRPEDHIDNPKDYADNADARQYDPRLRGPVNERVELAIDPKTGLKNYIANEEVGIMTSALHVKRLFVKSIQLGRSYARTKNTAELYEAFRLLGTGCHCLEDWSAHSNYTELCLIEMGERDVFPHVGRRTQIRLPGVQYPVFPVVTGTFGGVDFLHSVMGEFDDKATQNEIQQLEGTLSDGNQTDTSLLKELLSKIPSGIFGGKDNASKADELQANSAAHQMQQMHVTPKRPEAFTEQMDEIVKGIYPILEWHDELMMSITEAIEKIPVLPELIEQLEDQINIFVFSLLAPFVLPIIGQLKTELNQGSTEVIESSKNKQLIVFRDDYSTDPTHSMLSKDHFSNILNEVAGKVASQVLKWAVPQLIQCWDDERIDPTRTVDRIVDGVFHHPALRNYGNDGASDGRHLMFRVVEQWWNQKDGNEKDDFRRKLSREGVENLENHKEGVEDTGHGCGKPIGMAKASSGSGASGMIGDLLSAFSGGASATNVGMGYGRPTGPSSGIEKFAEEAVGGGALGGIVGAISGGIGSSLLGAVFNKDETKAYSQEYPTEDGGYTKSYTEIGSNNVRGQYGQAQYRETQYPDGGQRTEFQRYEQEGPSGPGYGFQERSEARPSYGGGYEERDERIYQRNDEVRREEWQSSSRDDFREPYGRNDPTYERGNDNLPRSDSSRREAEAYDRFEEPPREQYGGGRERSYGGGYVGGFDEPRRDEYSSGGFEGRDEYGEEQAQRYGNRGEYEREREEERQYGREEEYREDQADEYREEEYREERREGGWGY